MSDPVFKLGKFKFRSTSSDVNVFFEGQDATLSDEQAALAHTEKELEEAYQRGFTEAQAPLNEEISRLQNELAAQQQQIQEELAAMGNAYQQVLNAIEQQMLDTTRETSFKLAEAIIGDQLKDKETMLDMTARLLRDIQSGTDTLVKLSPEDHGAIGEQLAGPTLRCLPDASLKPGDIQIEQPESFWDANLKSRLDVLREEFNAAEQEVKKEDV